MAKKVRQGLEAKQQVIKQLEEASHHGEQRGAQRLKEAGDAGDKSATGTGVTPSPAAVSLPLDATLTKASSSFNVLSAYFLY